MNPKQVVPLGQQKDEGKLLPHCERPCTPPQVPSLGKRPTAFAASIALRSAITGGTSVVARLAKAKARVKKVMVILGVGCAENKAATKEISTPSNKQWKQ